jgi:hypothetical protein
MERFQIDLNRLREWALENELIINTTKSKAVCFTRARVTKLNYSLRDMEIPEASINYTAKKACKALHFTICILKKRNSNIESLAYTSTALVV